MTAVHPTQMMTLRPFHAPHLLGEVSSPPTDIPSGTMRPTASFDLRTLARLAGYLIVGGLGSIALLVPLAGVLAYLSAPFYPLLLGWFLYGGVLAVTRHPRIARAYVVSHFGVPL